MGFDWSIAHRRQDSQTRGRATLDSARRTIEDRWMRSTAILGLIVPLSLAQLGCGGQRSETGASIADAPGSRRPLTGELDRGARWVQIEPWLVAQLSTEGEPCRSELSELVRDGELGVAVVIAQWQCEEPSDGEPMVEDLTRTVHLVIDYGAEIDLLLVGKQHEYSVLMRPPPRIDDVEWRGRGTPGPALVLTVATEQAEGTQCDPAELAERALIVCDDQGPHLECASLLVARRTYDGCGGRERYDWGPGDEENPCARVEVAHRWELGDEALVLEREHAMSLDCDDHEFPPDLLLAGPRTIPYEELRSAPLPATRLRVE
jgi:hypothetical protein